MNRTTTFSLTEEFLELPKSKDIFAALGYLSTWGISNERYCSLLIHGDSSGNLSATYRNAAGEISYEISAIRRGDGSYAYHS